ncbi:MAG: MBL fold metallo-hydrolase [Negativicutes bacterium]|nr:MBL fold metallo-hydrolase [Negativicutes bacterium]
MKIKWLGHSCFLLTSSDGVRLAIDPFNEAVGYKVPDEEADIVTTSHDHFDHNYIQAIKGKFKHINKPGRYSEKGIGILGIPTFHDEAKGAKRGQNIVFKYTIDGINVCHCGDLGHPLTAGQAKELGPVDVLLVPVGGFYTIDPTEAAGVVNMLQPTVIIPMHFKTPVIEFPIVGVDEFLAKMGGGKKLGAQELELTGANLASFAGVVVLDFA